MSTGNFKSVNISNSLSDSKLTDFFIQMYHILFEYLPRCPKYGSIPAQCHMVKDAASPCCFKPVCDFVGITTEITGQLTTPAPNPSNTQAPNPFNTPAPNPNPNVNPTPAPLPKGLFF